MSWESMLQAMAQENQRKKLEEYNNPSLANAGLAGLIGLVSGGPEGRGAGALQGILQSLGVPGGAGIAGTAKSGLDAYTSGTAINTNAIKEAFTNKMAAGQLTPGEMTAYLIKYHPEEAIKAVLAEKPVPQITAEGYQSPPPNKFLEAIRGSIMPKEITSTSVPVKTSSVGPASILTEEQYNTLKALGMSDDDIVNFKQVRANK